MNARIIRIGNFVMTVIVEETQNNLFNPKEKAEEPEEEFFLDTAEELRRKNKIEARQAKGQKILARKSSQRYGGYGHRTDDPAKLRRRLVASRRTESIRFQ